MPTLTTIDAAKDSEQTYLPLLVAVITFTDATVLRLATKPLNSSEGGFTYGGNSYFGRILSKSLGAIQGFTEGGIDIIPRISLTLADADKVLLTTYEQAKGFKGATIELRFIFWEADTANFSSDSLVPFIGICDAAQADELTLTVSATNKLNLQRKFLPAVRLQRRCPWAFPTTSTDRQAAADDEDSIFYRCGYSPDATGGNARGTGSFTSCAYTKSDCQARGMYSIDGSARATARFGGVQWDPPAGNRSRDYTSGDWIDVRNAPNDARYGQPIPMVYGTAWVDAVAVNVLGDGNSTRGEAIVCLGEVESLYRVVVNDVELSPSSDITGAYPYIVPDKLLRYDIVNRGDRTGHINTDALYDGNGDPYGSMCVIEWVVPRRVADAGSTPRIRVLVRGPKIRVYTAVSTYSRAYSSNYVWILMDLLVQAGWSYDEFARQSWIDAAAICAASISYTDQYGDSSSHPRYDASLVLRQRRSAADLIRAVRRACGAILVPDLTTGNLQIFINGTLASQQPSAVAGSNYGTAVSSKLLNGTVANGYLAYDFTKVLRNNKRNTLQVITPDNSAQPSRVSFSFTNSERDYAADSYSRLDTDAAIRAGGESDQQTDFEGVNTLDHAKRIGARYQAELIGDGKGNPIYQFDFGPGFVRLRAGHICRLTNAHFGISNQLVRILQIRPTTDFRTCTLTVAKHSDDWYVDTYGQDADPGASSQARNRLERPSYPWGPKKAQPDTDDWLYGPTDWTFSIQEQHEESADGSSISTVVVVGRQPVNIFSTLAPPVVGRQGTTASIGGALDGDGNVYYFAVCAKDSAGLLSVPSINCEVAITAAGSLNNATIPILQWPDSAAGYAVFGGKSPNRLTFQAESGTTPTSITITAYNEADYGIPDLEFDKLSAKVKRVPHAGVFVREITAVATDEITIDGAGWTSAEWTNYDCTVLAKADGSALPVRNYRVFFNDSDTLTVSPDPAALGVDAGDILVMRSKPTVGSDVDGNYLLDALWANSFAVSGLTTDAEKGRALRIIAGPGRGEVYRIKKNSATKVWIDGEWITTPTGASRYIIEEPDWVVIQKTDSLNNADPAAEISVAVEVNNYATSVLLVQVFTLDGGENESSNLFSPFREIYVFGTGPGSAISNADGYHTITYAATITPDLADGLNQQVTQTGNITVNAPIFSTGTLTAGQWIKLKFIQDATGGRQITWHADFIGLAGYDPVPTASKWNSYLFTYNPDGKWELDQAQLERS